MTASGSWLDVNQQGLLGRLGQLRNRLADGEPHDGEPISAPALDLVASAF